MLKKYLTRHIVVVLSAVNSLSAGTTQDIAFFKEMADRYVHELPFQEKENPPILIMFSGTPAMGKTTLAKELQQELQAIRISRDEIRKLLREKNLDLTYLDAITALILYESLKDIPNRTVILDCSVDRKYDYCVEMAKDLGYRSYLIRLELSKEETKRRIIARGEAVDVFLRDFELFYADYQALGSRVEPDFYYDNSKDFFKTTSLLIEDLKSLY